MTEGILQLVSWLKETDCEIQASSNYGIDKDGSSSFEKRVDIIIKNYTNFMGIVDGYTEGLRYMIESEKESNSRQSIGDLGVRVQSGGMPSDTTAKKAIRNVLTREALINCDFSGNVLEGVDRAEMYIRDAYILRDMRKDYNLYRSITCIVCKLS